MKVVAQNRRARFDYEILETIEAGLVLTGPEVKSCRMGRVSIVGAYASFLGGKPVLKKATIARYPYTSADVPHDPERDRPLLLRGREAAKLRALLSEKGVTVIPLELRAGRFIKVLLGVGRGRKKLDKRQRIREREVARRLREGRET